MSKKGLISNWKRHFWECHKSQKLQRKIEARLEKPKNLKLQIAKKTPWTNMQGYLIQSIKIWNANYLFFLFLGTNLELSAQTTGHRYMYEDIEHEVGSGKSKKH